MESAVRARRPRGVRRMRQRRRVRAAARHWSSRLGGPCTHPTPDYAAPNAVHACWGPMAAITDQSTSELRTNLRARREYAATASGWRRKSALQSIAEMEDELEARGEP